MVKFFKRTALVLGAVMLMALPMNSASALTEGYKGFSFGFIGSDADFTTKGKEYTPGHGVTSVTDDINTTSVTRDVKIPSMFFEYSYGQGFGGITFGIEHIPGEHSLGSKARYDTTACCDGSSGIDTGTRTAKATVDGITTFYVEPALMINDYIGAYVTGGLTFTELKTIETTKTATYGDKDIFGGRVGVGVKLVSPWGLFVKFEQTESHFPTMDFKSTASGSTNSVKAKVRQESTRLALGFNF